MDEEWLVGLCSSPRPLRRSARRAPTRRSSNDVLLPYADRLAVCPPEICVGAVARPLAMLANDEREADRHRAFAAELHERIGARPWLERMRS